MKRRNFLVQASTAVSGLALAQPASADWFFGNGSGSGLLTAWNGVLTAAVDISLLPIIGQNGRVDIGVLPYDTTASAEALDRTGWKRGSNGFRARGNRSLAVDILFPATSVTRKRLAEAIQESWRGVGVRATITAVDFPVFQQRLAKGAFDSYIGAWLDEPSPRGLADQWTGAGWGALNYGHYSNPRFDTLLARASGQENPQAARPVWREALDTLNGDAPAIFLYAPVNVAAVSKRLQGVVIDPYSWLSTLPDWRIDRRRSGGED